MNIYKLTHCYDKIVYNERLLPVAGIYIIRLVRIVENLINDSGHLECADI